MTNSYTAIEVLDWESDLVHRMRDISDNLRRLDPEKIVEFTSKPIENGKWELTYTIQTPAQILHG